MATIIADGGAAVAGVVVDGNFLRGLVMLRLTSPLMATKALLWNNLSLLFVGLFVLKYYKLRSVLDKDAEFLQSE